jgi:hypothetical protein
VLDQLAYPGDALLLCRRLAVLASEHPEEAELSSLWERCIDGIAALKRAQVFEAVYELAPVVAAIAGRRDRMACWMRPSRLSPGGPDSYLPAPAVPGRLSPGESARHRTRGPARKPSSAAPRPPGPDGQAAAGTRLDVPAVRASCA